MLEIAHIVWTILLLAIFIAIVAWAWNKSQRQRFERAAWAPLLDESFQVDQSFSRATTEGLAFPPSPLIPLPEGEGNQIALRATSQGNAPLPLTLDPSPQRGEGNQSALRAAVNKEQDHG